MTNLPRNDRPVLARLARGGRGGGVPGQATCCRTGSHLGHSVPLIPMNLAMVIAVYAVISKHLGVPLRFPGKPLAYRSLIEMTDAGLLARAMVWAATDPRAANQAYNINNGDMFRWEEMWPAPARLTIPTPPASPSRLGRGGNRVQREVAGR